MYMRIRFEPYKDMNQGKTSDFYLSRDPTVINRDLIGSFVRLDTEMVYFLNIDYYLFTLPAVMVW